MSNFNFFQSNINFCIFYFNFILVTNNVSLNKNTDFGPTIYLYIYLFFFFKNHNFTSNILYVALVNIRDFFQKI